MRIKTCGAEQARTNLPELLDAAHRGSATIITKRGRPYAALVPVDRATPPHSGPSLLQMRNTGAGLWGRNSTRTLARVRDDWR
jgi:prevent-host-death family protein